MWANPYICGSAEPHRHPKTSRDTLNPKMLPCSCRSLLSRVLFPAPEGPLRTTGLGPDIPVGEWEQISAGLRDPSEWNGVGWLQSHPLPPPANSPQESELRAILKPWLHLPDGWATWYHNHLTFPAVHFYPTCGAWTSAPGRGTSGSPPRHFLGTMP